jgi:hypothetical protein
MKIADLFIKLGLKSDDFDKGIDKAKNKTNAFANGMKKIGGMIAAAFAVERVAAFVGELTKLSGEAEGVRAAFERINGGRYLDEMKQATAGTVSELELMKRAVSANNLGIPIENLASLFEFAAKRAQDTGESVDFLVNSIVTGIGRKSPLILDNLGISAIQLKEKLKGVGMETASVAQVAAAVGEIAADSMRVSGGIIETNATKIQQLRAAWMDFKTELATSPEISNAIGKELDDLKNIFEVVFSDNLSNYEKFIGLTSLGGKNMQILADKSRAFKNQQKAAADAIDEYSANIQAGRAPLEQKIETEEKHVQTIGELKAEIDTLKSSLDSFNISQGAEIQSTLRQIQAKEKLLKTLTELQSVQARTATPERMQTIGGNPTVTGPQLDTGLEIGKLDALAQKNKEIVEKMTKDWTQFNNDLNSLITDGIVNMIDEFAYSLGQLVSGEINLSGFFANILGQFGQFLGQMGKLLIAFGVAQLAFGESLKNIFNPANAPILIAAGAALVAISGAIGGLAKSMSSGGGGSTAAGQQAYKVQTVNAQDQKLVAKVSGRDLAFVLEKRTNVMGRT